MFKLKSRFISRASAVAILLSTGLPLYADAPVIGSQPDVYNSVPTLAEMQRVNNGYRAGSVPFKSFQADYQRLSHPVASGSAQPVVSLPAAPMEPSSTVGANAAASPDALAAAPTIHDPNNLVSADEKTNLINLLYLLPPNQWAGATTIDIQPNNTNNQSNDYDAAPGTLIVRVSPKDPPSSITLILLATVGQYYYQYNMDSHTQQAFQLQTYGTTDFSQAPQLVAGLPHVFGGNYGGGVATLGAAPSAFNSIASDISYPSLVSYLLFDAAFLQIPDQPKIYSYSVLSSGTPQRSKMDAYIDGSTIVLDQYRIYLDRNRQMLGYSSVDANTPAQTYNDGWYVSPFVLQSLYQITPFPTRPPVRGRSIRPIGVPR